MSLWSHCAERIESVLQRFPTPQGTSFAYGTAGFRTTGALLPSVGCRMAFVCALRSIVSGGKSTGLMITASHNPWADNGVKIVDVDGCMLSRDWEGFATTAANAASAQELLRATELFVESQGLTPNAAFARVHVARDTRLTGPSIYDAFLAGCATLVDDQSQSIANVIDHGVTTTPQLHTMVYLDNHSAGCSTPTTDLYYSG